MTTGELGSHLNDVLAWDFPSDERHQEIQTEGRSSGRRVVRRLSGPPNAPFRLETDPADALAAGVASVVHGNQTTPIIDGSGETSAGQCRVLLAYDELPSPYTYDEWVFPHGTVLSCAVPPT